MGNEVRRGIGSGRLPESAASGSRTDTGTLQLGFLGSFLFCSNLLTHHEHIPEHTQMFGRFMERFHGRKAFAICVPEPERRALLGMWGIRRSGP